MLCVSHPGMDQAHTCSQQPLPRQLDLPGRLPSLESSLGNTDALPVRQLELVLVAGPCAGAVVWEVHARERVWAEVVLAVGCCVVVVSLSRLLRNEQGIWTVLPLSTCDLYQEESEGAFCCCCCWCPPPPPPWPPNICSKKLNCADTEPSRAKRSERRNC